MTPLLSALRACCRGDWSKGVDERASTITLFSPPTLSPTRSLSLSRHLSVQLSWITRLHPLQHLSSFCHLSLRRKEVVYPRGAYSSPSTWTNDLSLPAAGPDHTVPEKVRGKRTERHFICFGSSQPPEAPILQIYNVLCVYSDHVTEWSFSVS